MIPNHRRALAALASIAVLAAAGCGSSKDGGTAENASSTKLPDGVELASDGKLTVGTEAAFPPFEFIGDDKTTIEGIDAELAHGLAKQLGLEATFANTQFAGLIPGLRAQKFDVIISAMTDNTERQKVLDFVDYLSVRMGALVKKGNPKGITSFASMCGHTIATQTGTAQVKLLTDQKKKCEADGKPMKLLIFGKDAQSQLAVRDGRADANIQEYASMSYVASKVSGGQLFGAVPISDFKPYPYGIGIRKGEPLVGALQAAFQKMLDSGEYAAILKKWDVTPLAVDKSSLNAATY